MSRDITNHDDIIDSRDVIARIEELEGSQKPFVAGWNMPGYMPDNEPARFESFDDARRYLGEELRRWADELEESEGDLGEPTSLREAADAWEALDDTETEYSDQAGRHVYWVSHDAGADSFDSVEEFEELRVLKALADEASDYAPDWTYGATLIRDSYFTAYAQEMLEDCGDISKDLPSYIDIDWEATARNIRVDYTSVEFDGVAYWIR